MVIYTCEKCNKNFDRKSVYNYHINKKFSCEQKIKNQNNTQEILFDSQKLLKNIEKNDENLQNNSIFCCEFCNTNFSRNDNLKRHLKTCKEKRYQDEQKENIFKLLLEKEEQMKKMEEEKQKLLNKIEEDNKKKDEEKKNLENYIRKITDLNLDLNNQVKNLMEKLSISNTNITNNNIVNNINNINISSEKLVDFGKEDVKDIDLKEFNKIFGKVGKHIFTASAGNIWNNKPKYKNLYVSDLSREKAMTVKNGRFELTPLNTVLITINQQLLQYFKYNLEHLEKSGDKKKLKNFDDNINKYYKMYFRAYADAKDRYIPDDKRLEEFDRVVNKELTEYFYNIKDDVKDNYNRILDDTKKDNILNKLNYEPPKKPRGRPKKPSKDSLEDFRPKKLSKDILEETTNKKNKEPEKKLKNLLTGEGMTVEDLLSADEAIKQFEFEYKQKMLKNSKK